MGTSRRIPPVVGALCLVAVSGCVDPMRHVGVDEDGGTGPANAAFHGDNGDGTYTAPDVPDGSTVYVAVPGSDQDDSGRTHHLVLNQVLVDPFVVDGNGSVLLNSDVLVSAELTAQRPQTVTYRIKPDVTWSDGVAWDCDDFYLAWLTRPTGRQETAECRDSLTFVQTYAAPDVEWRRTYTDNTIRPAHILEQETGISDITEIGADSSSRDLRRVEHFWNHGWDEVTPERTPASGPYRIESSDPDGSAVLVRNEHWTGNPGGPRRIVFVPVSDPGTAVEGLRNADLTVAAPAVDAAVAERLRSLDDQGVVFGSQGGVDAAMLDVNLARWLFRQPEVRIALAQCVDRNMLVEEVVRPVDPVAQPQGSLAFLPGQSGYEDRYSQRMPADPRQAQHTLERAGWVLGPDGVYARDGHRLSFSISYERSATHSQVAELLRAQCRQAGMDILDEGVDDGLETVLTEGSFDLALTDVALLPPVSSMADRYASGADRNHRRYANSEVDELLAEAQRDYSESAQVKALRRADHLIADDLVSFPLFRHPLMWAHRASVENVFAHDRQGITWNANEWVLR